MTNNEDPVYVEYPEYYDYVHAQTQDIPFYLEYAQESGSPILELACGTGRILIPLLSQGHRVTGVDLSPGMIDICQQRVDQLGLSDRASLIQANMVNFDLPVKDFAMAFIALRSFTHLYTQEEQLACLKRVHSHLRPGGLLIVAVFALNHRVVATKEEVPFTVLREVDLPDHRHVVQSQRFVKYDPATQIIYFDFKFEERDTNGQLLLERTVPMIMRYVSRYELQLMLELVGFEVGDVYRDYDKQPYNGKYEIIMISRKKS